MAKSKGAYEAEISKAITQWEKDFLGRGSLSVKLIYYAIWLSSTYKAY